MYVKVKECMRGLMCVCEELRHVCKVEGLYVKVKACMQGQRCVCEELRLYARSKVCM